MSEKEQNGLLEGYLPVQDAAKQLGLSKVTMWRLRDRVPYYRISGRIYYKLEDLQDYRDSARREPVKAK